MTYLPKAPEQVADALEPGGSVDDVVTRLASCVCGGQGPEADRVARRIEGALPDYLVALRDHELRGDRRTTTGQPKAQGDNDAEA